MKTLREIANQLKRIADSLTLIELTLMRKEGIKYTDLEGYASDYEKKSDSISRTLEGE